jgi:hypothetical protein
VVVLLVVIAHSDVLNCGVVVLGCCGGVVLWWCCAGRLVFLAGQTSPIVLYLNWFQFAAALTPLYMRSMSELCACLLWSLLAVIFTP